MKAILVRYLPRTQTRAGMYKASDSDGNTAYSNDCYPEAARALCEKMRWHGELVNGGVRHGLVAAEVYVFVGGTVLKV